MQRAMAAEAEAVREARAKVIAADGEFKASTALKEASQIISQSPAALQLRYLQVLRTSIYLIHLDIIIFIWAFRSLKKRLRCHFWWWFMGALLMIKWSCSIKISVIVVFLFCTDSERYLGREEFDHYFPAANRFTDSVHEVSRCCHNTDFHFNFKMMTAIKLLESSACFLSFNIFHAP